MQALADTHPVVVRVLAALGLADPAAARACLDRSPGDDNPFRMAGMDAAVARLRQPSTATTMPTASPPRPS